MERENNKRKIVKAGSISSRIYEAKNTLKSEREEREKSPMEKSKKQEFMCNFQKVSYKVKESSLRSRNSPNASVEKVVPALFKSTD